MTPTTPEQAREIAMHLFFPNGDNGYALKSLADQVEALTKERDEYKQRMQRLMWTQLETSKERDALQKQVDDFCMGYRMQTDIHNKKLVQERDALYAAAKLALEAMNRGYMGRNHASYCAAIEALRQAGVQ